MENECSPLFNRRIIDSYLFPCGNIPAGKIPVVFATTGIRGTGMVQEPADLHAPEIMRYPATFGVFKAVTTAECCKFRVSGKFIFGNQTGFRPGKEA